MPAPRQDLMIQEGETWSYTFTHLVGGVAVNLTGYTARCRMVRCYDASSIVDLTTENGRISIVGPDGKVTLSLNSSETIDLRGTYWPWWGEDDGDWNKLISSMGNDGRSCGAERSNEVLIYDVEIISPIGAVTRLVQGNVHVLPGATSSAYT